MPQEPLDANYKPINSSIYDPTGKQLVVPESGATTTASDGTIYAAEEEVLTSVAGTDAQAGAAVSEVALGEYTGAGVDRVRIITKFIPLQAVAITHATPVDVYTPTTGKKWRILSYHLSTTVAGAIQFEDTTGVEVLRTPLLLASTPVNASPMGNGILSAAANNHLFLDVTVTGNVSGWIGICEE